MGTSQLSSTTLWEHYNLSPHEVLAHGKQQEGEGDRRDDCGADGEQHLHRVEEEEHDQQRDGGSQRQAHRLQRVKGLNPVRPFRLALLVFAVLVA